MPDFQFRSVLFVLISVSVLLPCLSWPTFLACGDDNKTRIRPDDTIMGLAVGSEGSGHMSASILRDGTEVTHYVPGEILTVELLGLTGQDVFAMRVNDGGGGLSGAPAARVVANKCPAQVFAGDPSPRQEPIKALLTTPCDDAPAIITVSVVAASEPTGPMLFTRSSVKRSGGRASSCPPKPLPAVPLYPFNQPINETCPNGAAAQHRAPCPAVPCRHPVGKEGTCLTSNDGSVPDLNGSVNAEGRVDLLTDDVTPISHHFVTGAAPPPRAWTRDMTGWVLTIDGEVERPRNFTMSDIVNEFPHKTRQYVLECAGQWGRGIVPAAAQADWWNIGAVGCAEWTGVLLRDVLDSVGIKDKAAFVAYYGEDDYLSRGIPILKALDGHSMLAWAMNGEPIPAFHGFPLRLLAPGYPGSAQGKWLKRLWIRDRTHDGLGMRGKSYKITKHPVRPGAYDAPDSNFKVFTLQPVRSLIVRPPRCTVTENLTVWLEGKAYSGAGDVVSVEVSYDAGLTWHPTELSLPRNKWAWQRWETRLTLPSTGVWFIHARATDHTGATQPMLVPQWNPGGYGNNQAMMVDIEVLPSSSTAASPAGSVLQEKCDTCGHVYNPLKDCGGMADPTLPCGEGVPFENLPEDWLCPVCGVTKRHYHLFHRHAAHLPLPERSEHARTCIVCDHVYDPLRDCGGMDELGKECGEGVPFDTLPDSWRCPLCGATKANYHVYHAAVPNSTVHHVARQQANTQLHTQVLILAAGLCVALTMLCNVTVLMVIGFASLTLFVVSLLSAAVIAYCTFAFYELPPLMIGHVVGMLTCWAFMLIGSMLKRSINSESSVSQSQQARVPHAVLQSFACLAALLGVGSIWENHVLMGASQLGLDAPLPNKIHAILGWCILAMILVQGCQGWLKYLYLRSGKLSYLRHPMVGRTLIVLSSGNIVIILWTFQSVLGRAQVLSLCCAVSIAAALACLRSGPPVWARASSNSADTRYHIMPS